MTDLGQAYVSKDDVKRRLSLAYAISRYGIAVNEANRALCPWHQDEEPSLRIFVNEAGHQKWHCYPCSEGGDIFDFIMRLTGCNFPDALEAAEQLLGECPADFVPPAQQAVRSVDDWQHELAEARVAAAAPENHGYLSWSTGVALNPRTDAQLRVAQKLDVTLRDVFGWGVDPEGNVLMPHWNRDGVLTGCKVRKPDGTRWSKKPSSFRDLYGAWLGRRNRDVLITEGEKDCAWGYARAQAEQLELDVYSIPSGAGENHEVDDSWIEFLQGARTVYLVLDADDAGIGATRSWLKALRENGFEDVRVCRLPRDRDLVECRPNLRRLLAEATPPRPVPSDVSATPDGFIVTVHNRNGEEYRPLTTWTITPRARLTPGDEEDLLSPGLEVDTVVDGVLHRDVISNEEIRTKLNLSKWAAQRSLVWHGSDNDAARIGELLHAQSSILPEVFQTSRCGVHRPPERYAFSGPALVHPDGHIGQLPWKYVRGRGADINTHVLVGSDAAQGKFDFGWLTAFMKLSEPALTDPLIAWLIAAARRHEVRNFPLCYVGGPSGSGKSTICQLATRMFGSTITANLGQVTPFVLMTHLSSTTTLPVFLDEYTRQSKHAAIEALQSSIPVIYEGGVAERGQQDLSTATYHLSSPIIIAGEQTFNLDREVQRMITLRATQRDQRPDALALLVGQPIERFSRLFYEWLLSDPLDLPPMPQHAGDRPSYNDDVLRAGWATLRLFLDDQRRFDLSVPELALEPDLSYRQVVEAEHENVYETALEAIVNAPGVDGYSVVWLDPQDRGTWVRFNEVPPLATKSLGADFLPGGGAAIRQYFESKYEVSRQRTMVGGFGSTLATKKTAYLIHGFYAAGEVDETGIQNA